MKLALPMLLAGQDSPARGRGAHLDHTALGAGMAATANAMSGEEEKCRAAGMNGHLTKPISAAELAVALAKAF